MTRMTLFRLNLLSTSFFAPLPYDGTVNATYTDEAQIPEALKDFYTKKGDRWELNVVIEGVEGVTTFSNFERLNGALKKERADHKAVRDSLKKLNGKSIDEVIAALDEIDDLRTQLDAADPKNLKKIDELVEARLKTKVAPLERERDELKGKLTTAETANVEFQKKERQRKIHDAVRDAATKAKVLPEALDDALMLADRVMDLDDDDKVVVKDGTDYGVGLTPVSWFGELQTKKPHWWAPSEGNGAGGNRRNGSAGNNPWDANSWNVTQQSQLVRQDRALADKLAKQAGTSVGGLPAKKN